MGVYKRPDSPWWWLLLERQARKPLRESTHIPVDGGSPAQNKENRRQAQALYAARMIDVARARNGLPTLAASARVTFAMYRVWYLDHVSQHKRGVERERSMLKQLGTFFDPYALSEIDHTLAREWRTTRRRAVKASTINREEEVLKHLLSQAVPRHLASNPLAGMVRLRVEDVETRIMTPDEELALLAVATDRRARAILLCGLDALMRRGSVAALSRQQDHGDYLTVLNAKAGTYKVPVSSRLREALDGVTGSEPRFFGGYGAPDLSRLFADLCASAGVESGRKAGGVTFHSLRHTGASRMLERGVDVKAVMEIGGWSNLKVMTRYLHPTNAALVAAVETIGAAPPRWESPTGVGVWSEARR